MKPRFNNCIAIGVANKEAAAQRFVDSFEAKMGERGGDWIEVLAPPYRFYFVEDGTRDIAFSCDVTDSKEAEVHLESHGFVVDDVLSSKVGEAFVRDPDGILVNLYPGNTTN